MPLDLIKRPDRYLAFRMSHILDFCFLPYGIIELVPLVSLFPFNWKLNVKVCWI